MGSYTFGFKSYIPINSRDTRQTAGAIRHVQGHKALPADYYSGVMYERRRSHCALEGSPRTRGQSDGVKARNSSRDNYKRQIQDTLVISELGPVAMKDKYRAGARRVDSDRLGEDDVEGCAEALPKSKQVFDVPTEPTGLIQLLKFWGRACCPSRGNWGPL